MLKVRIPSPGDLLGRFGADVTPPAALDERPLIPRNRPSGEQARPIRLPPLIGDSKSAIAELVGQSTSLFLCDDSGSMYGSHWGDDTGIRYAASKSLIDLMRKSGGGRAGVVHWGTDAPAAMALAPVDVKKGRRALDDALTIPPTLGGNDLSAALRRAKSLLTHPSKTETVANFVLTDGIEDVTPAIHAAVRDLPPRTVHMVLVDRSGGCTPDLEAAWQSVAFGSFTRLDTFDTKQMATQIATTYANALGLELQIQNK